MLRQKFAQSEPLAVGTCRCLRTGEVEPQARSAAYTAPFILPWIAPEEHPMPLSGPHFSLQAGPRGEITSTERVASADVPV